MAKTIVAVSEQYWRTIAVLAGGDPTQMGWDAGTGELELPGVVQATLDTVVTNFDILTPHPTSWPTSLDVTAVTAVSTLYWKDNAGVIVEMTQAEKDAVTASVLASVKVKLMAEINIEAEKRIYEGLGFEWPAASGNYFSLSAIAQSKWIGLAVAKDYMTFPLTVATKADNLFYDVADATEAMNMYLTATGTVKTLLGLGTTAKQNVDAATTVVDAQAAADAYLIV